MSIYHAFYKFYVIRNLEEALREFHPDILVYNAGTDVLDGDRLGLLAISAQVSKLYEIDRIKCIYDRVRFIIMSDASWM
jgi:histone deacetylase 11